MKKKNVWCEIKNFNDFITAFDLENSKKLKHYKYKYFYSIAVFLYCGNKILLELSLTHITVFFFLYCIMVGMQNLSISFYYKKKSIWYFIVDISIELYTDKTKKKKKKKRFKTDFVSNEK